MAIDDAYRLKIYKDELWKGIPMSRESYRTYKRAVKLAQGRLGAFVAKGQTMDSTPFYPGGPSFNDLKRELERCAERDRKAGGKCGLLCQVRKQKKGF